VQLPGLSALTDDSELAAPGSRPQLKHLRALVASLIMVKSVK